MRIQNIHIERFGAWRDQDLELANRGLTVLYGPNEAGKSTVMRFVRRLLFGFRPEDESGPGPRSRREACAGRLALADARGEFVLRRESEFGTRGRVVLTHVADGADSPAALGELLSGVSEECYEHVFAVGLEELQQLATLQGNEAAQHIFHRALGPEGERIVAACRASEPLRRELWDEDRDSGMLRTLAHKLDELDREIADLGDPVSDFRRLQQEGRRVDAEIADQKQRLNGLREQLRGHLYLERVWGPWHRQQQVLRKRAALAVPVDFPEDGLERLEHLSRQITEIRRHRRVLRREARELAREAAELVPEARLEEHASQVRRLLARLPAIAGLESGLERRRQQAAARRRELAEQQQGLGSGWPEQRLAAVDGSPAAAARLCAGALRYRHALHQRSRCLRKYQRLAAHVQQEQAEHAERLREFGGRDFDEVYDELTGRATALEDALNCQVRAADRTSAATLLRQHAEATANSGRLPPYFYGVLGLFGAGGTVLLLLGLFDLVHTVRGGPAPWQVGAVFLLLGTCCAAVTWTMKRHFDPSGGLQREINAQLASAETGAADARRELALIWKRFTADEPPPSEADGCTAAPPAADRIAELQLQLRQRLAELGDLEQHDHALREQRGRLSEMRVGLRDLQRRVGTARREWCTLLKELGLDESVQIGPTITVWRLAAEARELQAQCAQDREALARDEQQFRDFHDEVAQIARDVDGGDAPDRKPAERLADWQRRLTASAAARARRRELCGEVRARRREAERQRARIAHADAARRKLLTSVGVASRDEFLELHRRRQQLREVERQLAEIGEELSAAAQTEPELAIVEEDLLRFDVAQNRHAVETIRSELADLERDLQASHEQSGRLTQEMHARESDRSLTRLRRERAQLAADLDQAVARYCAVVAACRALDELRDGFERNNQPETLMRASAYLARLTAGKYARVWTPAGERRLVVDDDLRQSLCVERLSSGTREQLFLSIRLALIDQHRERGVDLPVLLDDVCANFDQARTEAAVETLADFAARGPQVLLFTCHLHLARLFEEAGVTPVRLPEPEPVFQRRRVG